MNTTKYWNRFGLLNPTSLDIVAENAFPTTLQYHNVYYAIKGYDDHLCRLRLEMYNYITYCDTKKDGLYNQFPKWYMNTAPGFKRKDKFMSKDQLMAFALFLEIYGNRYSVCEINNYLRKHWGCYNNLRTWWTFPRFMGFQTINLLDYLANPNDENITKVHKTAFNQLSDDFKNPNRSTGALKAFTILSSLSVRRTDKKDAFKLVKQCVGEFKEYYQEEDHPIRKLLVNM